MHEAKVNEIDLLGQFAVNFLSTTQAAKSPTMRLSAIKGKDSPWLDLRLWATGAGVALYELAGGNDVAQRVGFDAASAFGHSFTATEAMRRVAQAKAEEMQKQLGSPVGAPVGAPVGTPVGR